MKEWFSKRRPLQWKWQVIWWKMKPITCKVSTVFKRRNRPGRLMLPFKSDQLWHEKTGPNENKKDGEQRWEVDLSLHTGIMKASQSQMVLLFVYCNSMSQWPISKVLFNGRCQTSSTFDLLGCECERSKEWKWGTVREDVGLQKVSCGTRWESKEEETYQTLQPHRLRKAKQKTNK